MKPKGWKKMKKPKGWKNEPGRHSLAARGIKTGKKLKLPTAKKGLTRDELELMDFIMARKPRSRDDVYFFNDLIGANDLLKPQLRKKILRIYPKFKTNEIMRHGDAFGSYKNPDEVPQRFIIVDKYGREYFVNNEGYGYNRYMVRIT